MGAFIELSPSVRGLKPEVVRAYEPQYIVEEDIIQARFGNEDVRCAGCPLIFSDNSIDVSDCPSSFEFGDVHCLRWNEYYLFKLYIMQADLMLRNTLGDLWTDEYSA